MKSATGLCFLVLCLVAGMSFGLPKSGSTTYHQNCYYAWTYNETTGYMDQTYICGEVIPDLYEVEDDVPYEGCYYGEDCYDDYVGDP